MTDGTDDRTGAAADAVRPVQLSARSWHQLVRRAASHVVDARLPFLSAGIAFFAVLSVAPVLVTALSVYQARMLHTSPEALALLGATDFYLSVVHRETDQSVHMEYVPLPVFRQAVAVARSNHSTWLASQHPRPAFKPRQV